VGDSFEVTWAGGEGGLIGAGLSTAASVKTEGMPVRLRARDHRCRLKGRRAARGWGGTRGWVSWARERPEEVDTGGVPSGGPSGRC
jgi:hypothetical protein